MAQRGKPAAAHARPPQLVQAQAVRRQTCRSVPNWRRSPLRAGQSNPDRRPFRHRPPRSTSAVHVPPDRLPSQRQVAPVLDHLEAVSPAQAAPHSPVASQSSRWSCIRARQPLCRNARPCSQPKRPFVLPSSTSTARVRRASPDRLDHKRQRPVLVRRVRLPHVSRERAAIRRPRPVRQRPPHAHLRLLEDCHLDQANAAIPPRCCEEDRSNPIDREAVPLSRTNRLSAAIPRRSRVAVLLNQGSRRRAFLLRDRQDSQSSIRHAHATDLLNLPAAVADEADHLHALLDQQDRLLSRLRDPQQ